MADIYVTTTGNDSTGTGAIGNPYLTVSKGVSVATPPSTVHVGDGLFTGALNTIRSDTYTVPSGTSGNAIRIVGGGMGVTTLRPPAATSGIKLTSGDEYLVFEDFTVDMVNTVTYAGSVEGIYVSTSSNDITFRRLEVMNGCGTGISVSNTGGNSPYIAFYDCNVHDIGDIANGVNSAYAFYCFATDLVIDGCEIYDCVAYAIHNSNDAGADDASSRHTISNNYIHDNGTAGGANAAIIISRSDDSLIFNNLCVRNRGGIRSYTSAKNTHIYNNTIVDNVGDHYGIEVQAQRDIQPTIKNNICYGNSPGNHMNWDVGGTPSNNLFGTDPSFVSAGTDNYHLQTGSAAKDTGVNTGDIATVVTHDKDGRARPQGAAYCMGAYEYYVAVAAGRGLRLGGHFNQRVLVSA